MKIETRSRQMNSGNNSLFVVVIVAIIGIFGAFGLWQYGLHKKLSKTPISCGGEWSYAVKCPFGSYCRSLGQGPLAGGLCKPWLSVIFEPRMEIEETKKNGGYKNNWVDTNVVWKGGHVNNGVYINVVYSFKIELPPDWQIIENTDLASTEIVRFEHKDLGVIQIGALPLADGTDHPDLRFEYETVMLDNRPATLQKQYFKGELIQKAYGVDLGKKVISMRDKLLQKIYGGGERGTNAISICLVPNKGISFDVFDPILSTFKFTNQGE